MAKKKKQQDFDALAHLFDTFPHGASLSEIEAKAEIPRRTLVRRLAGMVEAGIIVKSGARRGVRYHRPGMPPQEATDNKKVQPDLFVPLSKAGGEVFRLVSRPLHLRTPVSYNREFLERYQPNQSSYLTNAEKAHLHELGRTSGENEPAGTYAQHVLNRLLIDLSWNSSRLEGNTYSLLDTQRLIELGEPAEEKAATDAQMILNHKAAIEFLVQSADEVNFNRSTILNLHALLADNLLANPNAAGRLRSISVAITKSVYLPLAVPQLIEECFLKLLGIAAEIRTLPMTASSAARPYRARCRCPYLTFACYRAPVRRLAGNGSLRGIMAVSGASFKPFRADRRCREWKGFRSGGS